MKFVIAATVLTLVELSTQTDYCNKALCGSKPHVACNGPTLLSPKCGAGSKEILMDAKLKALIVDEHNQFRSKIATGKQEYAPGRFYPQAARMVTVQWDDELAYVAGFNVRSCNFAKDECHNTDTFKAAGQNFAAQVYPGQSDTTSLIKAILQSWYGESSNANPSIIASYPQNLNGSTFTHFTQLAASRNSRVGCAMDRPMNVSSSNQYFLCNYALANIVKQPVYEAGTAGSKCTMKISLKYTGLCNESEPMY